MEYLDVKTYAERIGKSEKTVYKMIKNGFLPATKEGKAFRVAVDTNLMTRQEDTSKQINDLKDALQLLNKRVENLEKSKKSLKKSVLKKPLKKSASAISTKKRPKKPDSKRK